jgi:RsiW-degrading membrane proteinase PrsW (M82 family)
MTNLTIILGFTFLSFLVIYFMLKSNRGQKEPVSALIYASLFGIVGFIIAGFLEYFLIPANFLNNYSSLLNLLIGTTLVGIIEELLKFGPLALFIYKKRYFNEHIDGIIYFVIAGLTFGLFENILYTINYGSKTGLTRMLLTPLFHGALTGMVGYFLIKNKLDKKNPLHIVWVLLIAIILHAFYDFGLLSANNLYILFSVFITLSLSVVLFIIFIKSLDLDKEEGLSVVGINNYCRSCGAPNPDNHLYCIKCGKRA